MSDDQAEDPRAAVVRQRLRDMPDPLAMLRFGAARAPDRDAILHYRRPDDAEPHGFTYARAADTAARFAGALVAAGIQPGDSVAIIAPSIPENLLALAGAASVATAFPLNLLLSAEAMAGQLTLAGARAVVTLGAHPALPLDGVVAEAVRLAGIELVVEIDVGHGPSAALAACGAQRVGWDGFLADADPDTVRVVPGPRTAIMFHTGGTTGSPKLAELGLDAVMAALHASAVGLDWRDDDRVLQLFPFFHVGGALIVGLALFSSGATMINCGLTGARDPAVIASLWPLAARVRASVIAVVPASWSLIAAQGEPSVRWPELRALVTGATAVTPALADRLRELTGVPMAQALGMTELCGTGANQPLDGVAHDHAVGYPVPLVETRLVPIAPGGPTELQVRGPMLFSGYRTAAGLEGAPGDGWYATGDLGEILPDGQLRLVGRAKDVIIRSGHNIDPLAVEDVVCRHPAVVMAAAVGMPDAYAGELPIVYAVVKADVPVSEAELLAFVAERIEEPPARPKRVCFVDALPLTLVGKIARFRLRQQAAIMRLGEVTNGLAGIAGIDCEDVAARRMTVALTADGDQTTRQAVEAAAGELGLTVVYS